MRFDNTLLGKVCRHFPAPLFKPGVLFFAFLVSFGFFSWFVYFSVCLLIGLGVVLVWVGFGFGFVCFSPTNFVQRENATELDVFSPWDKLESIHWTQEDARGGPGSPAASSTTDVHTGLLMSSARSLLH